MFLNLYLCSVFGLRGLYCITYYHVFVLPKEHKKYNIYLYNYKMNLYVDLLKSVKDDIIDTVNYTTTTRFKFQKVVKVPKQFELMRNVNIKLDKKELTEHFYDVTQLSKLNIYVDFIDIEYEEKNLYDDEIKSYYLPYTQLCVMYFMCLPICLPLDVCRAVYNNLIVYPFVSIKYRNNPPHYFFTINLFLRKSLVDVNILLGMM